MLVTMLELREFRLKSLSRNMLALPTVIDVLVRDVLLLACTPVTRLLTSNYQESNVQERDVY